MELVNLFGQMVKNIAVKYKIYKLGDYVEDKKEGYGVF